VADMGWLGIDGALVIYPAIQLSEMSITIALWAESKWDAFFGIQLVASDLLL